MKLRRAAGATGTARVARPARAPGGRGTRRWVTLGLVVGALFALLRYAPASWAANAISSATDGRLTLADAQGTVWDGDALLVLTGGAGSRDALALPSRFQWVLRPAFGALSLTLTHPCCLQQPMQWRISPGWRRVRLDLGPSGAQPRAQWPAHWLVGFGTPWNTLQPGGLLQFSSPGLSVEIAQGAWRLQGSASFDIVNASSRVSPLDRLGSYHVAITGTPGGTGGATGGAGGLSLMLSTIDGALQLSGSGQSTSSGMRFRGEARAAPGQEVALNNLLNIIGRRSGAMSVISIG